MRIRFLLDEHMPRRLVTALKRHEPAIDVLYIGDEGAPPNSTPDSEILIYCEQEQRMLVTNNCSTMPEHAGNHFAVGRHHWGILETKDEMSLGQLIEQLLMFWGCERSRGVG
jgi:hypothetical protein